MTRGCKFHFGNRRFAQIDWGTVSRAIRWLELPSNQILRPQLKRTRRSIVRSEREGRASRHYAKARTASESGITMPVTCEHAASPVLQRWHEEKAIESNLGDRAASIDALTVRASTVVLPISFVGEVAAEALHGVGEAHIIDDSEDSITSQEKRSLTCVHDCPNFMDESILRKE
jgi:hypothetical protein